jgi:hypothetical protein
MACARTLTRKRSRATLAASLVRRPGFRPRNVMSGSNSFDVGFVLPNQTGHIYQAAGSYPVVLTIKYNSGEVFAEGTYVENISAS